MAGEWLRQRPPQRQSPRRLAGGARQREHDPPPPPSDVTRATSRGPTLLPPLSAPPPPRPGPARSGSRDSAGLAPRGMWRGGGRGRGRRSPELRFAPRLPGCAVRRVAPRHRAPSSGRSGGHACRMLRGPGRPSRCRRPECRSREVGSGGGEAAREEAAVLGGVHAGSRGRGASLALTPARTGADPPEARPPCHARRAASTGVGYAAAHASLSPRNWLRLTSQNKIRPTRSAPGTFRSPILGLP